MKRPLPALILRSFLAAPLDRFLLMGLVGGLLLVTAGCANAASSPSPALTETIQPATLPIPSPIPPTSTAVPQPTAAVATPTASPVPPSPIVMAIVGEPQTLHPLYATGQAARIALAPLFVGCIGQDETGAPVALGCERVPTLENGDARFVGEGDARHLEVTFRIRAGWRWTDGQPVTAEDALFAWQLLMAPEAQVNDPLIQKVYAMEAPDERTIVVRFMSAAQARAAAAGALQGAVAFEYFSQQGSYARYARQSDPLSDARYWAVVRWLPAHLLADIPPREHWRSSFAERPVGDGAFEMVEWRKGREMILVRSAQPFPLTPAGNALGLIFKFAPDPGTASEWVRQGEAHLAQPLSLDVLHWLNGTPDVEALVLPMPSFEQITLNLNRPPFDDVRVRQALRLAVDVPAILTDPAVGVVTAAIPLDLTGLFYGVADNALAAHYDPAQARALLQQAGWQCDVSPCVRPLRQPNGSILTQTLSFTLVTNERVPRNALGQILQKQLAQVGFGVDLLIVSGVGKAGKLFAPYEAGGILLTRNFDAALYQMPALTDFFGVFDCAAIPDQQNHSPAQGNAAGYCDPSADALMIEAAEGESVISAAGRVQAVQAALATISNAVPLIPLYTPVWAMPVRGITGLRYAGFGILSWNAWEWGR
ncbi:MAG: ABC transporter substrate-binding protein [Anaerolineae bacterium]|nr:ABC transporter substrate-binding protein [Thermoflexales bacterium]MDW8406490.1 ABC transporter substrate-binding protein [Anaerolineae bacterium]